MDKKISPAQRLFRKLFPSQDEEESDENESDENDSLINKLKCWQEELKNSLQLLNNSTNGNYLHDVVFNLGINDYCPIIMIDFETTPLNNTSPTKYCPGYIHRVPTDLTFEFTESPPSFHVVDLWKAVVHIFECENELKQMWGYNFFSPYESTARIVNGKVEAKPHPYVILGTAKSYDIALTQDYVAPTQAEVDFQSLTMDGEIKENLSGGGGNGSGDEDAAPTDAGGNGGGIDEDTAQTIQSHNLTSRTTLSLHDDFYVDDEGKQYKIRKLCTDQPLNIPFPTIKCEGNDVDLGPQIYRSRKQRTKFTKTSNKKQPDQLLRLWGGCWRKSTETKYNCNRYQHPLFEDEWITQSKSKEIIKALATIHPDIFTHKTCGATFRVEGNHCTLLIPHACDLKDVAVPLDESAIPHTKHSLPDSVDANQSTHEAIINKTPTLPPRKSQNSLRKRAASGDGGQNLGKKLSLDISANISSEEILRRVTMAESYAKEALSIAKECFKVQKDMNEALSTTKECMKSQMELIANLGLGSTGVTETTDAAVGSSPNEKSPECVSFFPPVIA